MYIPVIVFIAAVSAAFIYLYKKDYDNKTMLERMRRALNITKCFGDTDISLYRCFKSRGTLNGHSLVRAWVLAERKYNEDRKTVVLDSCYNENMLSKDEEEVYKIISLLPYEIDIIDYDFPIETLLRTNR